MHGLMIEIALSLIENFIIIQIINYFLTVKSKKLEVAFVIIFSLLAQFINTMNTPAYLLIPLFVLIVYVIFNYKNKVIPKCVISIVVFEVNAYVSFCIIALLEAFQIPAMELLLKDTLLYISLTIISKIILITLFLIFRSIFKRFMEIDTPLNWNILLGELILFFSAVLYSFYVFASQLINATAAIFLLIFYALNFAITLYYFYKYIKESEKKKKYEAEIKERMMSLDKLHEEAILFDDNYREFADIMAQFKQIRDLLDKGNTDEVFKLLDVIDKNPVMNRIEFKNKALDFLLHIKYKIMEHHKIDFQAIVGYPLLEIEFDDLIFIVSSLLDDAIIALTDKENAVVKFEITKVNIGIKLTVECSPLNKMEKAEKTIEKLTPIINKYNGMINSQIIDKTHIYKIIFMLDQERKKQEDGKDSKEDN